MPEPKRGYQVRIKQPVRQSSITCIPTHSRSWYHQDRRTHIFFLSFSAFLCTVKEKTDLSTVCGNHCPTVAYCMWYTWRDLFIFLIYILMCYIPTIWANVRLVVWLDRVQFHGWSFTPAGPACLSVTVSSSKPKVEVHEHTGETVHTLTQFQYKQEHN